MATITPVATSTAGAVLPYAAASGGGDTLACGLTAAEVVLNVRNGGSSITVTLAGAVPCSQGSLHNKVFTVAAGDEEIVIPAQCINPTNGNVAITYSSVTSVTVAATIG
jgi:hypothetical protein